MVASVPELTMRTMSIDGKASTISWARRTSSAVGAPNYTRTLPQLALPPPPADAHGQDHRTPRPNVINIGIAIDIVDMRPGGTLNKWWLQASRFVGTHGAINTARNDLCACSKSAADFGKSELPPVSLPLLRAQSCRPRHV